MEVEFSKENFLLPEVKYECEYIIDLKREPPVAKYFIILFCRLGSHGGCAVSNTTTTAFGDHVE